ncbi:MAG: M48 family metalloprotease [Armatimonadota bacterium]
MYVVAVCVVFIGAGSIVYAKNMTYDNDVQLSSIIRGLPDANIGIPETLPSKQAIFLFITTGASYTKVALLSSSLSQDELTKALLSATQGAGLSAGIVEKGTTHYLYYQTAVLTLKQPQYGSTSISNTIPVGKIIARIKSKGLQSYALLRVPDYLPPPNINYQMHNWPRSTWFNVSAAPETFSVTTRATLSWSLTMFIFYIRFVLPGIGIAALIVGVILGLRRRLPEAKRIAYFDWFALAIPLIIGVGGLAQTVIFSRSIYMRMIEDMWFADPFGRIALWSIWICPLAFAFIVPLCGLLMRSRVFRGMDNEPDVVDLAKLIVRIKRTALIICILQVAYICYLFIARPVEFSLRSWPACIGILSPLFIVLETRSYWRPSRPDPDLTDRARTLARRLGNVIVEGVRVSTGAYAKRYTNGIALIKKHIIIITQNAVENLTTPQMDYLLAHELAHLYDELIYLNVLSKTYWLSLACACVQFVTIVFGDNAHSMFFIWTIGLVPITAFMITIGITEIRRRLEYEADIRALQVVGDLQVCISALEIISGYTAEQRDNEIEMDEHPKTNKRINALKAAAAEMGIPVA